MLMTPSVSVNKVSMPKTALRQLPIVYPTKSNFQVLCWFYADALGARDYRHQPICLCETDDGQVFMAYPEYYKLHVTQLAAFGKDAIPFAIT